MSSARSKLREYVVERAGYQCEWPGCGYAGAHMAHIEGIGMGGRKSADTPGNVLFLCIPHHDQFDGRAPYDPDAWSALLDTMPLLSIEGVCRWPECPTLVYEVGLCYHHVLLTTSSQPTPGRKQAAAAILRQHVARIRHARGEVVS